MKYILLGLLFATASFGQVKTFTIASGASLSAAVDMRGCTAMRIITPAGTGTVWTAADLTFQHSEDDVTYGVRYDDVKGVVTVGVPDAAATASVTIEIAPGDHYNLRFLKIQSGTPTVPVVQAASRTLKVICR